jgi:hypothetical protein
VIGMILSSRSVLPLALLSLMVLSGGCAKKEAVSSTPPGGPAPMPGMGGPGGMPARETGKIMAKVDRGPQSLRRTLGNELNADPTPWDSIQPKTKEYAQLAAELGKHEPPSGDKESWKQHTSQFANDATVLDQAAQKKDLQAAKAAQDKLNNSCMGCHRAHRMGPGGRRPRGGFKGPPPQQG